MAPVRGVLAGSSVSVRCWAEEVTGCSPGVQPGNGSARAVVRVYAVAATKRLLDVWAETTMGRTWDDFLKMTQLETEAVVGRGHRAGTVGSGEGQDTGLPAGA